MTRRIGLAQALINDPELILLDEPTSGLDPIGTREMKDLILELKDQGKTVVMCSHLLADVQDVCDRIAILHQGELKELGRVDELAHRRRRDADSRPKDLSQDDARTKSAHVIARHHGELVSVEHPTTTLEELFLIDRPRQRSPPGPPRRGRRDGQAADAVAELDRFTRPNRLRLAYASLFHTSDSPDA